MSDAQVAWQPLDRHPFLQREVTETRLMATRASTGTGTNLSQSILVATDAMNVYLPEARSVTNTLADYPFLDTASPSTLRLP